MVMIAPGGGHHEVRWIALAFILAVWPEVVAFLFLITPTNSEAVAKKCVIESSSHHHHRRLHLL
jgi:hypothetical protein